MHNKSCSKLRNAEDHARAAYHQHCCDLLFAVNTNVSLPLTSWQLEVRMRWVKAAPLPHSLANGPTSIHEFFDAHPLRTKLYSVGLMCSPRWALMWAWVFDQEPGLKLLHQHVAQHQVGPCSKTPSALKPAICTAELT